MEKGNEGDRERETGRQRWLESESAAKKACRREGRHTEVTKEEDRRDGKMESRGN